jgi:hypothetical protein
VVPQHVVILMSNYDATEIFKTPYPNEVVSP